MSRSIIRLAVVGDSGVGKTSLIIALCNESFSEGCPPVLPPTRMPASYLPFDLPFEVIDTCTRPEERVVLEQTCLSADAILLLFASGISFAPQRQSHKMSHATSMFPPKRRFKDTEHITASTGEGYKSNKVSR